MPGVRLKKETQSVLGWGIVEGWTPNWESRLP